MEQGVWQEIEQLYQKFQQLGISEAVDYEKYYLYSLITPSTAIEGSTLTEAEAQMLFDEWLKQRAHSKISEIAKPIIKKFSERFKAPNDIYFQDMPTRWGSCTIKNKLIFNPKLIHTPKRCIEYVIMHELCHTVHKHHNQDFFDLLTLMMPDWEKRKEKLDSFA